jgi:hypothetical protein
MFMRRYNSENKKQVIRNFFLTIPIYSNWKFAGIAYKTWIIEYLPFEIIFVFKSMSYKKAGVNLYKLIN